MLAKLQKIKWVFLVLGLMAVYLALAWKDPFKQNNLISNLEPGPDTFYYSVPAWNWVNGKGFKMEAMGREIALNVPPFYGMLMIPLFKIFGDFRSYYFLNVFLGIISIFLVLEIVKKFFTGSKIVIWLQLLVGLVLVTNFYFYNLPTLLMAENIQIVLIELAVLLMMSELSPLNLLLSLITVALLWFSKLSNFPVIVSLLFWLVVKFIKTKFWKKISKKNLIFLGILFFIAFGVLMVKVIFPYLPTLIKGSIWFSFDYCKQFFGYFLSQFLGINGKYLWYTNQQIDKIAALISVTGLIIGLLWKKYRFNTLILLSVIFSMVFFHSFMYYPEGRYISVVVPLFLVFSGLVAELFSKFKLGVPTVLLIILGYLLVKVNINGFYERKVTTLKRQVLNNQLEANEVPWNYVAVQNFNHFFETKDDNKYFGSLLNEFYFQYFGNGNFNYLPLSHAQEFGLGKSFLKQVYGFDGDTPEFVEKLLIDKKEVYVSNYYLIGSPASYKESYKKLENKFAFKEVSDGCMGLCKIYQVELRKK